MNNAHVAPVSESGEPSLSAASDHNLLADLLPKLTELPAGFLIHREQPLTAGQFVAGAGFQGGLRRDYVGRIGLRGSRFVLSARCAAFEISGQAVHSLDSARSDWVTRQRAMMAEVSIDVIGERSAAAEGWVTRDGDVLAVASIWFVVDRFLFQFIWMGSIDVNVDDVVAIAREVAQRVRPESRESSLSVAPPVATRLDRFRYRSAVPIGKVCPVGYLIKGNENSRGDLIYHVPGGRFYDCTVPSECFATVEEAEAVGYRPSKR